MTSDLFVNLVLRATELMQEAERVAPDSVRRQTHFVLLEMMTLMAQIGPRVRVELPS